MKTQPPFLFGGRASQTASRPNFSASIATMIAGVLLWLSGGAEAQYLGNNFEMFHYNRQRQGWNANEAVLAPSNVGNGSFGEVWDSPTLGTLTAVPLYLDNVTISGGTFSGYTGPVVYAATGSKVSAINAAPTSTAPAGTILWQTTLSGGSALSTPFIDVSQSPPVLYTTVGGSSGWQAYAINVTSGAVLSGWPVAITTTTIAAVMTNSTAVFQPGSEDQRGGLNLSSDGTKLYVPFGSPPDGAPGYLVVIDTQQKALLSAFCAVPSATLNTPAGGMWASSGVALDSAGKIYVTTGNTGGTTAAAGVWGMCLLVFNAQMPLTLAGTYTPWNYPTLESADIDLCGSGPILLPDLAGQKAHTVSFGGKQGNCYLVDRDNLTGSLTSRPPTTVTSDQDPSFLPPTTFSYYNNKRGPLNVFGPYSESQGATDFAKSRATPACFQTADGTVYVVHAGANKQGGTTSVPPCMARLKVNTSPSSNPYLSLDATENTVTLLSAASPIVTSSGNSNFVMWELNPNQTRGGVVAGLKPQLVAVDPLTMQMIFQTANGSFPGDAAKYNEVSSARGQVFVGTNRVQAFAVTSQVYAIACGGTGAGNFHADAFFSGGQVVSSQDVINTSIVTTPAPTAVYQSARVSPNGGSFTYTFTGLTPNAPYRIRLHFCDFLTTGQRQFNVTIGTKTVLSNYNIATQAGAVDKAITTSFACVSDATGALAVTFTGTASAQAMVNGIEIGSLPKSIPQELWSDWLGQNQLAGTAAAPTANPAGDGIPNLLKYMSNGNPGAPDATRVAVPQFAVASVSGSRYVQFSYRRFSTYARRGLSFAIQTSPDLTAGVWTTQPASEIGSPVPTGDGMTETVMLRLQNPVSPGTNNLFARMVVSLTQ